MARFFQSREPILIWLAFLGMMVLPVLLLDGLGQEEKKHNGTFRLRDLETNDPLYSAKTQMVSILQAKADAHLEWLEGKNPTGRFCLDVQDFIEDSSWSEIVERHHQSSGNWHFLDNRPRLILSDLVFYDCNLTSGKLSGVNFYYSGLLDVSLDRAELTEVDFNGSVIKESQFYAARLTNVAFSDCLFNDCRFTSTKLTNVSFYSSEMVRSIFYYAELAEVGFGGAGVADFTFENSSITNGKFSSGSLSDANFRYSHLTDVRFENLRVADVNFSTANLTNIRFYRAQMRNVNLMFTQPKGLFIRDSTNHGVSFPPVRIDAGSFEDVFFGASNVFQLFIEDRPILSSFSTAKGLENLTYGRTESGLITLRSGLKELGMRKQERQVNYAINHQRRLNLKETGSFWEQSWYFVVEKLTGYGMHPEKPLFWMFWMTGGMSLLYFFPIMFGRKFLERPIPPGIWLHRSEDASEYASDFDEHKPTSIAERYYRASNAASVMDRRHEFVRFLPIAFIHALYFSAMVTFRIGWKDLSIGNWITRIDPRGVVLKSTGWVRTVSGLQSIVGVVLFAFFLWGYFTVPLE